LGADKTRREEDGMSVSAETRRDARQRWRAPQSPVGAEDSAAALERAGVELAVGAARAALDELGEEIAELAAQLDAATYRLLVKLRDFDARDGWSRGGFQSCAHWLSWRTGIAPGAAREKVRVAHALAGLPRMSRVLERGRLSYSKVRALTRIATPANEAELVGLALHATAAQLERIVRAWRRVDRLDEAERERERHESRALSLYVDEDGSYIIRGRLDPEAGAVLERALERATELLYRQRETAATPTQRRADALGLVAELALAGGRPDAATAPRVARRAERFQVVVHVDAAALTASSASGHAVIAGGPRVSAETSRRLACDASRVTMTHAPDGKALDVGRRMRTVPPSIRRALEQRDRGCRFPGCTNRICDAHHVRHWADGGATRLDNLLLLCRRHHRAVHEDGFRVEAGLAGELHFYDPQGVPLPSSPPAKALSAAAVARLVDARRAAPRLATEPPRGYGAPLDLDWTMRALLAPPPLDTPGPYSAR
jgi:hypothetical protein